MDARKVSSRRAKLEKVETRPYTHAGIARRGFFKDRARERDRERGIGRRRKGGKVGRERGDGERKRKRDITRSELAQRSSSDLIDRHDRRP